MHSPTPPQRPAPYTPPTQPSALPPPDAPLETYHTVADTVGLVPNLRLKDNLLQTAFIVASLFIGAGIGFILNSWTGMLIGSILGLVAGTLVSGLLLMVLGWVRVLKNRRK